MNSQLRFQDLWKSLSTEEIEDGCRNLLEPVHSCLDKNRISVLESLAVAMRFRPVFLRRRSVDENLPSLVNWIKTGDFERFRTDVVRAWLIAHHRPMFVAFLDASGVPQKDGFIEGKPPAPAPSQFEAGISRVIAQFKARDVGLYLGYLILAGDALWSALPQALDTKSIEVTNLLTMEQPAAPAGQFPAAAEVSNPPLPEDSDEFTTLDNWLIRTAVSSAFGESGAQTPAQVEDLVEEIVSLNAPRQHTLFHRGYLHALFGKPFVFHFPGENEERRLWYFTGVLFGLLRAHRNDEVLKLLHENTLLFGLLCDNKKVRCGSMLLPQVHPILWEAKEFGMSQRWLEQQLTRMRRGPCADLIFQIHYDASSLLRRGQWAEAEGFLNLLDRVVRTGSGFPPEFPELFLPANDRKRAQLLQLKGDFHGAEALLKTLSAKLETDDAANALSDLGLIRAGFRSLPAVLPTKDEQSSQATADALERGREHFEKAVGAASAAATNASFCLGLMGLLRGTNATLEADYLKAAMAGMLQKEDAYREGGLIQWTRFLLGVAVLESAEPSDFPYACDLIEQSIQTTTVFPLWLWSRAMKAAAIFDDQSLGQRIAEHLLNRRGINAYRAIWESGLALSISSLRETYLKWLDGAEIPIAERWEQLTELLAASAKDGKQQQAQSILDEMERLAVQGGRYRPEFLKLLEDDWHFSPAWTIEDAESARIRLHELEGNFPDATALLRSRFFRLRESGDYASVQDAESVLERMASLGADGEDLSRLRSLMPENGETSVEECSLVAGAPVFILYVGGNETQIAYEAEIRSELRTSYPGLKIEFYYPGWDSKWNVHLDKVRPMIFQADAVVLSTMVRTQFGRHVRATCGSSNPWFPCTGKGKQSLKRSIAKAAIWAANQKSK